MYPEEDLDDIEDNGTMYDNVESLAKTVVGHKIVKVEDGVKLPGKNQRYWYNTGFAITLDNGKRVFLVDSSDCCAYTTLNSFLLNVDKVDHVIMGVGTTEGFTKWHIYADWGDVLQLEVDWSAGNPFYYGYGFDITVIDPDSNN